MPTKVRFAGVNHTQIPQVVSDGIALKGLPQTSGYPVGYGDLAASVNKTAMRVVTPYDYGLTESSTPAQVAAAFQSMFDDNSENTEFRFRGDVTTLTININDLTNCFINFVGSTFRLPSTAFISFDELMSNVIIFGQILPSGARSGSDIAVKFVGLTENEITLMQVGAFTNPILIHPVGATPGRAIEGYYYNSLLCGEIGSEAVTTSAVLITTTAGSAGAYVNENDFRLKNIRALGAGVRFVKGAGQTDPFNGNTFYKAGLERIVDIGFDLAFCTTTIILHPRFENQFGASRFNTAQIRDASDCSQNIYELITARESKIIVAGANTVVRGILYNEAQNRSNNGFYVANAGSSKIYNAGGINFNPTAAQNLTEYINGNSAALDNNKPFAKYLRFVKGADGVSRGAGFVQPFAQNLITSWTNGQVVEAGLSSFVRIQNGTSGNVLNLRMSADREINGFSFLIEITNLATEVNIQNSSGVQQVALTAFQTGGDARGLFAVVYRDDGWRISQLGGILKNA